MQNRKQENSKEIFVTKASGEQEVFTADKLARSLRNAGAGQDMIEEILADIMGWIHEGVTTKKIYSRAFGLLHRKHDSSAIRYKLKQAIMELGPTGFPFEKFIGRLFEKQGYHVLVGQIVTGHCVTHEVDVIATGDKVQHLAECKYSEDQGKNVSVQVPLYVRSRMDDVIRKRKEMFEYQGYTFTGWVITNTRFSPDALQFGKCSGLHLMSWDYPAGNGLKDLIEREKIYPVTLIGQLNRKEKEELISRGIVTCSQLSEQRDILRIFNLSSRKLDSLLQELESLA